MIWAFQLAIVARLSSALDRTLTRAGRKPRPGLGDRRHRPVCRPPLLAPAYRVAMRFLRRNWAHSPLGTRRCSSRNAIATVLEGGRVEYFTPAHVLPTHRPRPVGAAWRFCWSSCAEVTVMSEHTPASLLGKQKGDEREVSLPRFRHLARPTARGSRASRRGAGRQRTPWRCRGDAVRRRALSPARRRRSAALALPSSS